jgi:serine/threonine protein kinase
MAPEQAERSTYGKKVDIYAAGLILYQLLTGEHAFFRPGKDSERDYLRKLSKSGDLELPKSCKVSPHMRDLFSRLCKKAPGERYDALSVLAHPAITGNPDDPIPMTASEQIICQAHQMEFRKAIQTLHAAAVLTRKRKEGKDWSEYKQRLL